MLTINQHRRVARTCATAVTTAIETLPDLLKRCEPEDAAAIVADLAKACMGAAAPEVDPGAALAEVIRIANRQEKAERADELQAQGDTYADDLSTIPSLPVDQAIEPSDDQSVPSLPNAEALPAPSRRQCCARSAEHERQPDEPSNPETPESDPEPVYESLIQCSSRKSLCW